MVISIRVPGSCRIGGGENAFRARLVPKQARDEIIDAAQRGIAKRADRIAQIISHHDSMISLYL